MRRLVATASASVAKLGHLMKQTAPPDHLADARFVRPNRLHLHFDDGLEGTWTFPQLGINPTNLDFQTMRVVASGTALEVKDSKRQVFQLDAASVRAMVDTKYAASMADALSSVEIPDDVLLEYAARYEPPARWQEDQESDLF
jgi:hypothetical protein